MVSSRRVAVVTGCAKQVGLGASTARTLAAQGMDLLVTDRTATGVVNELERGRSMGPDGWGGLPELCEQLRSLGADAVELTGDVADPNDVERLVQRALERFGRVDVLVNNAAAPHGAYNADIEAVPLKAWDEVFAINIRAHFLTCQAIVPIMRRQRFGRIINIASTQAKYGRPHSTAYAASKAAVVGFSRSLALDVAGDGITVNSVLPGPMRTSRAISSALRSGSADVEATMDERGKEVPVGHMGHPDEVAALVAFFASDEAGYITAQAVMADGGKYPIA